jgi:hypothetical protein
MDHRFSDFVHGLGFGQAISVVTTQVYEVSQLVN